MEINFESKKKNMFLNVSCHCNYALEVEVKKSMHLECCHHMYSLDCFAAPMHNSTNSC